MLTYYSDPSDFYIKCNKDISLMFMFFGVKNQDQLFDWMQDFYIWIIHNKVLPRFDPSRGKFSTYMQVQIKNFIWMKRNKKKPVTEEYEDWKVVKDNDLQEAKTRIESFRKFCLKFGRKDLKKNLLREIKYRVEDCEPKFKYASQFHYTQIRKRFVASENKKY